MATRAGTHSDHGGRRFIAFSMGCMALAGAALAFADPGHGAPGDAAIDRAMGASTALRAESVTEARLRRSIGVWPGASGDWVLIDEWIVRPETSIAGTPPGRTYRSAVFAARGAGSGITTDDYHSFFAANVAVSR